MAFSSSGSAFALVRFGETIGPEHCVWL